MNEALRRQMLEWLEKSPRLYTETMEAWRTSCPRLSIWEDALIEDLVEVVRSGPETEVRLTAKGMAWLRDVATSQKPGYSTSAVRGRKAHRVNSA